jgi:hypothetical protein
MGFLVLPIRSARKWLYTDSTFILINPYPKVWIALEEKNVPYRYHEVRNLAGHDKFFTYFEPQVNPYKKEKDFLQINPLGLVPVGCLIR